jgi:hypothetical protein
VIQACGDKRVSFGVVDTSQRGPLVVTGSYLPLLHIHKGRGHAGAVKNTTRGKHLLHWGYTATYYLRNTFTSFANKLLGHLGYGSMVPENSTYRKFLQFTAMYSNVDHWA